MTAVNPQMQALQTQSIVEQRKQVDEALGDLRKALDAPLSGREWLLKIAAEVEQEPSRWTQGANALDAEQDTGQDTGHRVVEYKDSLATATEFVSWFRRAAELCI